MNTRHKKAQPNLPFTQLWYNFAQNDSIRNPKYPSSNKNSNKKKLTPDLYPKQRRSSISYLSKRPQISINNCNDRISMILLQGKDQEKDSYGENQNMQCNGSQKEKVMSNGDEDSTYYFGKNQEDGGEGGKKGQQKGKDTDRVSDKVLKIIEVNVIPFLVEKFVQVEQKMAKQFDKLQNVVKMQGKQIQNLKKSQQYLRQQITKYEKPPQTISQQLHKNKQNISMNSSVDRRKKSSTPSISKKASPIKISQIVQINSEPTQQKAPILPTILKARTIQTQQSQQLDPSIKQLSLLLQQITSTIQETGIKNVEQFNAMEKQIKRMVEKQRESQEKLEKQFAERIMELITTYNDNFVDLDQRISFAEGVIFQNRDKKMGKKMAPKIIDCCSDNKQTNRNQ